jgi:hypothetical protein
MVFNPARLLVVSEIVAEETTQHLMEAAEAEREQSAQMEQPLG